MTPDSIIAVLIGLVVAFIGGAVAFRRRGATSVRSGSTGPVRDEAVSNIQEGLDLAMGPIVEAEDSETPATDTADLLNDRARHGDPE